MPWLFGTISVLLSALLAASPPSSAFAAQPSESPNRLQAVDYALLPAEGALVRLTFAQPVQAPPRVLVNHYPTHRISFDFPDTVSVTGKRLIEVGPRGLRSIQLVQSGRRIRVILELDRPFTFNTVLRGAELLITLRRLNWGIARNAGRIDDI